MTVKVTLEFLTAADAAAFLEDFDNNAEPTGEVAAPAASGKPRGRPRKADAAAAAAPAAAPAAAASAAPAPAATAPTATASAVPFKDVADAITKLAEVNRDNAVAVLAQFGARTASELKPEQFAGVVAACNAKLAAPAATSLI